MIFFNKTNSWKEKAKDRGKEINKLKKDLKRLSKSRDNWKNKASTLEELNKAIDDILKKNF